MIKINTKIHDLFSIEIKKSYMINGEIPKSDFSVKMWIFVPNSLDVNIYNYGKDQFYRDMKSNVRIIIPAFEFKHLASAEAKPFQYLERSLKRLTEESPTKSLNDLEHQTKMFTSIVESALSREVDGLGELKYGEETILQYQEFINNSKKILNRYRGLNETYKLEETTKDDRNNYFSFADEYLSLIFEKNFFKLIRKVDPIKPEEGDNSIVRKALVAFIRNEIGYRETRNYVTLSKDNVEINQSVIYRRNLLKKYLRSHLFLNLNKKEDGMAIKQLYYSIAAGIAMVFATFIAFYMQKTFGNFSFPLFIALVVSYMCKDRIKELVRFYFGQKLSHKYFDNKSTISIAGHKIGQIKEGVDFIATKNVPKEILEIRNTNTNLKAENRIFGEKVILYREYVNIRTNKIDVDKRYITTGLNNIMRLHLSRFVSKMDNPYVPIDRLKSNDEIETINALKLYNLNLILEINQESGTSYKHYRCSLNRLGIKKLKEIPLEV